MSHWLEALPRPLAFVLSGGASLGAVQVGMLEALAEVGAHPDLVVGSSVGALNGAVLAERADMAASASRLREMWEQVRAADVFPDGRLQQAANVVRGRSLYRSEGLRGLIEGVVAARSFEELRLPLAVVALDVRSGHAVTLTDGALLPSLLASSAIPGLLPAVKVGDRVLWDAGVANNVPLSPAIALGSRSLVVLDAGDVCHLDAPPRPLPEGVVHAVNIGTRQRVLLEAPLIAQRLPIVYLPRPCIRDRDPLDVDTASALIERARRHASRFLAEADPPVEGSMAGSPHAHDGSDFVHAAASIIGGS